MYRQLTKDVKGNGSNAIITLRCAMKYDKLEDYRESRVA